MCSLQVSLEEIPTIQIWFCYVSYFSAESKVSSKLYHYPIWLYDQKCLGESKKKNLYTLWEKWQTQDVEWNHWLLENHWVLVQMLCILWFSLLSGIVSQQSPSVCGFLSPLECRVWVEHSWSILITLAGWRWRKKAIDHKGKGRSKKKNRERTRGWDIGSARVMEIFFFCFLYSFFFVPKLFGSEKQGQHDQSSEHWCMLA